MSWIFICLKIHLTHTQPIEIKNIYSLTNKICMLCLYVDLFGNKLEIVSLINNCIYCRTNQYQVSDSIKKRFSILKNERNEHILWYCSFTSGSFRSFFYCIGLLEKFLKKAAWFDIAWHLKETIVSIGCMHIKCLLQQQARAVL